MAAPIVISQTDVINKAQTVLGQSKRFSELLDSDQKAIDYKTLWPIALRAALALHPWNHAIARARLLPATTPPEFGYAARYRLPPDCVRYLPWSRDDAEWFEGVVEDGHILTDQPDYINIRYVRIADDMSRWSPGFVDVMAYTLAMESCEGSTGKRGLYEDLERRREEALQQAKRADALEGGNRERARAMVASSWASARYRTHGWRR